MDVSSLARMAGRGKPTIHDTTRHCCTLATFLVWTAVHRGVKRRDFLLQRGSCRVAGLDGCQARQTACQNTSHIPKLGARLEVMDKNGPEGITF